MKKVILMMVMCAAALSLHAQKFALVDMDYIFKSIPAYERANEQLNQVSKKWQAEVDALQIEAQTLYKNYQNEVIKKTLILAALIISLTWFSPKLWNIPDFSFKR